jgi:hypothetical protein
VKVVFVENLNTPLKHNQNKTKKNFNTSNTTIKKNLYLLVVDGVLAFLGLEETS